ncbi:MAG: OmpH family outer membrane protein [Myroides sp.]|nr:OmpH family outer membrane protein [Myroides sp.]
MKKIFIGSFLLMGLVSCQDKIGYVDNSKLLNDYQEKKDIETKLQAKIDSYEKKRDSISRAFQTEAQQFDVEAKNLAQSVAQRKYNELIQKSQMLQQHLQQEEQKIQLESQTEMDSLVNKVKKFVKNYGKDKGFTYILGANEGGSVLYGIDEKDITDDVLKALNDNYKK